MARVRLEIDNIEIDRPKKRWRLYFVVVADHPTDSDKMIISTFPHEPFLLSPRHDNFYAFDTANPDSEGLFVLSRPLPENRELNVHIYVKHTRQRTRDLGKILTQLEEGIGDKAFGVITDIVGTTAAPWLQIAKTAVPLVGQILSGIKDRDLGFLSAFERFDTDQLTEIDYRKPTAGHAWLTYSWSLEED